MSYYGRLWEKRREIRDEIESYRVMAATPTEARKYLAVLALKVDEMEAIEKEMDLCDDDGDCPRNGLCSRCKNKVCLVPPDSR